MRKSKFSEEQIIGILKEADAGVEIATLLRRHGISRATLYQWRSKYAGATVNELRRIKELEAENAKLKRMYADLALENTAIKDVLSRKL
jgi:putative transposase